MFWKRLEVLQTYKSYQNSGWSRQSQGPPLERILIYQKFIQTVQLMEPFWRYLGSLKQLIHWILSAIKDFKQRYSLENHRFGFHHHKFDVQRKLQGKSVSSWKRTSSFPVHGGFGAVSWRKIQKTLHHRQLCRFNWTNFERPRSSPGRKLPNDPMEILQVLQWVQRFLD